MLPTPEIKVWSSRARLTPVCRRWTARPNTVVVEGGVERVEGDVGNLGRDAGGGRLRDRETAERALVDEAQLGAAVGEGEAHAQVELVRRLGGTNE